MKICFVTSLFGDSYDFGDKPAVFPKNDNYDYFLFTNLEESFFNTSWKIINIKEINNEIQSNIIKSRYPKFMCWKLLEDMDKIYDVVIYCDCHLTPNNQQDWEYIGRQILSHPSRITHQRHLDDAYKELNNIVECKKDNKFRIKQTLNFLKANNFPEKQFMSENTVFGYDPNDKKLQEAFSYFWQKYSKYEITHRDQPLWSFVLWKYDIQPLIAERWCFNKNFVEYTGKKGFNGHHYV
tara:strand:+ start:74 stop:787 length:714 start_codon:yes stop_codon:yes gene_type:complete